MFDSLAPVTRDLQIASFSLRETVNGHYKSK